MLGESRHIEGVIAFRRCGRSSVTVATAPAGWASSMSSRRPACSRSGALAVMGFLPGVSRPHSSCESCCHLAQPGTEAVTRCRMASAPSGGNARSSTTRSVRARRAGPGRTLSAGVGKRSRSAATPAGGTNQRRVSRSSTQEGLRGPGRRSHPQAPDACVAPEPNERPGRNARLGAPDIETRVSCSPVRWRILAHRC